MGRGDAFHLLAAIRRCTSGRVTDAQFPLYSAQISFGQPVAQYLLCAARTGRSSLDGGTCLAFPSLAIPSLIVARSCTSELIRAVSQNNRPSRATVRKVPIATATNIPRVVSNIDHDVRSRRRKLVLSPHCLWLPFGRAHKRGLRRCQRRRSSATGTTSRASIPT